MSWKSLCEWEGEGGGREGREGGREGGALDKELANSHGIVVLKPFTFDFLLEYFPCATLLSAKVSKGRCGGWVPCDHLIFLIWPHSFQSRWRV